jgi:chromosome segregation ATPase
MDTDETVDVDDESTMSETSTLRLLKERDDVISSLVKLAAGQDKIISVLRSEIEVLNSKITTACDHDVTPDIETVQQLQKEAEVFASQVIELDAEIEQLKSTIVLHVRHVADLEHQLENSKLILAPQLLLEEKQLLTNKILELEAEIDELKEANVTQQDELRNLRRKVWNTASVHDEVAKAQSKTMAAKREVADHLVTIEVLANEKAMLCVELSTERANKAQLEQKFRDEFLRLQKLSVEQISSLEEKLDESRWLYDELKASPSHVGEEAVVALRNEMEVLRQSLNSQTEDLRKAQSTIKELEEILADRNAKCAVDFEEEKEELLAEIEALTHRLNDAQDRVTDLEADSGVIADFKEKLERADFAREESEKNIVDTFDRQISLLPLDKDLTIDKLRKELTIENHPKQKKWKS